VNELIQLVIDTLSGDTALRRILGARTDDGRVYRYYQPEAVITDSQPAYITLATTANPERTAAIKEPVISLATWAKNWSTVTSVEERIYALLDYTDRPQLYLTTPSGRKVQPIRMSEHDSAQENTKFAGKQYAFRFGESAV
jgi:hypothetical protein